MPPGNFEGNPGALILLSGLPGAGKTTLAVALAAVLPFDHIESDAIRRTIARNPTYAATESARVFAKAEALAAASLAAGRNALIDATNLSPSDRKRFLKLADRSGSDLVAIRVTAPDEVIRQRLSNPRAGFSQATPAVYDMMRDRPRPFTQPAVVVDTRFPLEPSLALICALVTAATGR